MAASFGRCSLDSLLVRATWLASLVLYPTAAGGAELEVRDGEIRLNGVIASAAEHGAEFVLTVKSFVLPSGKASTLPTPKPKTVRFAERAFVHEAGRTQYFRRSRLDAGMAVSVVGPDQGTGQELVAREVVVRPPRPPGGEVATIQLAWRSAGLLALRGYRTVSSSNRGKFDPTRPASAKRVPDGLSDPVYAEFKVQVGREQQVFAACVDRPGGKPARLLVDAAGTGEVTTPATWELNHTDIYARGEFTLAVRVGSTVRPTTFSYNYWYNPLYGLQEAGQLDFCCDAYWAGQVSLGGRSYPVAIDSGSGNPPVGYNQWLSIDRNHNGKTDRRGEHFYAAEPFNLDGTTYEISELTDDGRMVWITSGWTEREWALPPDLSPGQPAPPFKAVTLSGKPVSFPGDYAGKVVLLFFWYSSYLPDQRVAEIVETYQACRAQGFEILAVNLDGAGLADKLRQDILPKRQMTWDCIYEGRGMAASLVDLYAPDGYPGLLLVDGSSGRFKPVWLKDQPGLRPAVVRALAERGK